MMRQALQPARPGHGRADMRPAIGGTIPLHPGLAGRTLQSSAAASASPTGVRR
jgi:hypothetical protein